MSDVANLVPDLAAQLLKDDSFVTDLARYQEGILTEKYIRKKYGNLSEPDWSRLSESDELVSAIEAESVRRMMDGSSKKEKAKLHVLKAPEVLASLMNDSGQNARHRIDACKVLDDFSQTGPADRFCITINLGADTYGKPIIETYNKSFAIDPNDTDPNITPASAAIAINADPDVIERDSKPHRTAIANEPPATTSKTPDEEITIDALMMHGD
jgi:hypothetical protein